MQFVLLKQTSADVCVEAKREVVVDYANPLY